MKFSPHSRSKTRKSNAALLLRLTMHNSSAVASINPLDRITYQTNQEKTRKSFVALLLPHLFAVSPLLRYSYKKMGGGGPALRNLGAGGYPPPLKREGAANYQRFLSLTKIPGNDPKISQCFLSLTGHMTRKYLCFLFLTKKGGGGGTDPACPLTPRLRRAGTRPPPDVAWIPRYTIANVEFKGCPRLLP